MSIQQDTGAGNAAEKHRLEKRQKHAEELKTFDADELLGMPPERLAEWQSGYEQDEPQWVLADQEWKRRAGISTRKIAIAAIAVSILSFLVAALGFIHSLNSTTATQEKSPALSEKQPQLPAPSQK